MPILARAALAAAGVALLACALAVISSPLHLGLFVLMLAVFTAPGWPLARWYAGDHADRITTTLLALVLGYVVGATVYCGLRLAGITSPAVVLGACGLVAGLLAWGLRGPRSGVVTLAPLQADDRVGLGLLWLLAALLVGPVFARVGQVAQAGLAYRAYFIADLFAHMSVVAELVKGAVPPVNPYFAAESLPYYWTYFTLPALFSAVLPSLPVDRGILLTDLMAAAAFTGVAYIVVRQFCASALAASVAWFVVVAASSFEGAAFLFQQEARQRGLEAFRFVNIDAVTRWFWDLPPVDGYQRIMWYTPQHELAVTLGLLVVAVFALARRRNSLQRGLIDGLLLGGAFAISSFNGLLFVLWYAIASIIDLVRERGRDFEPWLASRAVAAMVVLGFVGLTTALEMVQRTPGTFVFGWNRHLLKGPWTFLFLSFGPALFLAPFGLRRFVRRHAPLALAFASLVALCALALGCFDIRGHENAYVSFRTAQLFYLVLAVLLANAVDQARAWKRPVAVVFWVTLALGSLATLPTVALDWYNARDTSNVEMNPGGFPWTVHVPPDDQQAVRWIQQHLPVAATVQMDAAARGRATWALVPAFAYRRMSAGVGLFEPNYARYDPFIARIHALYQTSSAEDAYAECLRLGINYLYVGDVERRVDGPGLTKFAEHPDRFPLAFRLGSVEIYEVKK
ncbi:MAG: hypothetical protein IMZ67_03320 [Acidobacteria bacterium]|nr:hypothetical protein [Acidobacteriota bacterium]